MDRGERSEHMRERATNERSESPDRIEGGDRELCSRCFATRGNLRFSLCIPLKHYSWTGDPRLIRSAIIIRWVAILVLIPLSLKSIDYRNHG